MPAAEDYLATVRGPSDRELRRIDAEWPLIAADMAVLDAEITILTGSGTPSPLDQYRLERARVHAEALTRATVHRSRRRRVAA